LATFAGTVTSKALARHLQAIDEGAEEEDEETGLSLKAVAQQMTAALSPGLEVDR
jgi:hypothetical protein